MKKYAICIPSSDDFALPTAVLLYSLEKNFKAYKDCDIIVASDKEQNIEWLKCSNLTQVSVIDDCDHIFHHTEWEQHSGNIFSYKCILLESLN